MKRTMKTEQPKNGIQIVNGDGCTHVEIECDAMNDMLGWIVMPPAKSEGAALRKAAKKLRALADLCEELA